MGFFGFGKKNKEKEQEKMKTGLEKTRTGFWGNILNTLTGSVIDDDMYDDLEEQLILADVGGEVAVRLVDKLRDRVREKGLKTGEEAADALRDIIAEEMTPEAEMDLSGKPAVILVIGVNGVGKTTSIAKLADYYTREGKKVMLAAGDTFRAAASEQLEIWADRAGVPDLENPKGGIEFRDLTFRYPDGEFDVLKNISFTIQPGESVGIVGKTGAGKTALVDLLLRTYNVPDGTLFVDGQDVNAVSIHSVRDACAYVPQDNFLFSDTIAHNIGFGVDDASQADIDRAAALADVRDNIVDFKDGYETVLGERGVTVSGGQKQRISIARALLKNAPILILDDSVSAVDTRTEKIILDNLKTSRAGKTTLLIAHRISTVEQLDKIVFIEDGRVEAVGPHDELYRSCAEYRRMVDLQKLEDEEGGGSHG